jgi:hypothetical protein
MSLERQSQPIDLSKRIIASPPDLNKRMVGTPLKLDARLNQPLIGEDIRKHLTSEASPFSPERQAWLAGSQKRVKDLLAHIHSNENILTSEQRRANDVHGIHGTQFGQSLEAQVQRIARAKESSEQLQLEITQQRQELNALRTELVGYMATEHAAAEQTRQQHGADSEQGKQATAWYNALHKLYESIPQSN